MKQSKYFKTEEMKCKCCGVEKMHDSTIDKLDKARELAGIPFNITSGYRCPKHNAAVGGKPDSAHQYGYAVDIAAGDGPTKYKIITSLLAAGFVRIGYAKNFIHCDDDPTKPQKVIWDY